MLQGEDWLDGFDDEGQPDKYVGTFLEKRLVSHHFDLANQPDNLTHMSTAQRAVRTFQEQQSQKQMTVRKWRQFTELRRRERQAVAHFAKIVELTGLIARKFDEDEAVENMAAASEEFSADGEKSEGEGKVDTKGAVQKLSQQ